MMGKKSGYSVLNDQEMETGCGLAVTEKREAVSTPYGDVYVSIENGCDPEKQAGKPAMITYHDIGTNHTTCFGSFFALEECRIFKELFCVYHIDAPGHEEGAKAMDPKQPALSIEQLGEQVGFVLKHLGLTEGYKRVYGFGVGAGCSVLLSYSTFDVNQKYFAGMILVNGSGMKCGWREWIWHKALQSSLWLQGMSQRTKRYFLYRHFTPEAIEDNEDLVENYDAALDRMHAVNILKYCEAYAKRRDLADDLDNITVFDVIQFAGSSNPDFSWHCRELNKMFELGKSQVITVDECSGLVTEEGPHHMANPIKYWLGGKGYVLQALDIRPIRHPEDNDDEE